MEEYVDALPFEDIKEIYDGVIKRLNRYSRAGLKKLPYRRLAQKQREFVLQYLLDPDSLKINEGILLSAKYNTFL